MNYQNSSKIEVVDEPILCGQNTLSIFIKIKDSLFSEQPTFSPMLVIRDVGNLVKNH
jgi:hypothetical protein